jgi:hypothetical protein
VQARVSVAEPGGPARRAQRRPLPKVQALADSPSSSAMPTRSAAAVSRARRKLRLTASRDCSSGVMPVRLGPCPLRAQRLHPPARRPIRNVRAARCVMLTIAWAGVPRRAAAGYQLLSRWFSCVVAGACLALSKVGPSKERQVHVLHEMSELLDNMFASRYRRRPGR